MSALKPCPFCGAAARLHIHERYGSSRFYSAGCVYGHATSPELDSKREAREWWNRRHAPEPRPADPAPLGVPLSVTGTRDTADVAAGLAAVDSFMARLERDALGWKAQAQQATSVLAMVRAMIGEMFGPIANLESAEATLYRGPEPKHDGEAILTALQNIADYIARLDSELTSR